MNKYPNRVVVRDSIFLLKPNFHFIRYLGEGAYGVVWYSNPPFFFTIANETNSLIRDVNTGVDFAVKKNNMMFQSSPFGRRLLREIKVLKHL